MATIFDQAKAQIRTFKEDKEEGRVNSVPVPFPRLADKFPGWERGMYVIITANSGIGKTKLAKYLMITSLMRYQEINPGTEIHVRWYALEEPSSEFAISFVSIMLAVEHGIFLSPAQLKSLGSTTLTDGTLKIVEQVTDRLNKFMENVEVIDHIMNPFGIWKDVREFADSRGKFFYQKDEESPKTQVKVGDGFNIYEPDNPKEFVFIATDHISLLHREKAHKSDYEAIGKYSKDYCLGMMVKRLNYTVCNVQQQVSDSEKMQWNYKGQAVEAKVEPSLDGLANNKETQRDADMVLGIFAPTRYEISNYHGYKINPHHGGLGNAYRCVKFLKDRRYGLSDSRVHLFFDGAINYFEELPHAKDMTDKLYDIFRKKGRISG